MTASEFREHACERFERIATAARLGLSLGEAASLNLTRALLDDIRILAERSAAEVGVLKNG